MRKSVLAVGLTSLALTLGGITATASASLTPHQDRSSGLVFVQNDDAAGNKVMVYRRSGGGLRPVGTYATGGRGGRLEGSVVDHLASQGALTYDSARHTLYAVNAGSDTVSVFGVEGDRLVRRQVIVSGGDFPVSVAVHGNRVYVLNARDGGSLQGYLNVLGYLIPVPTMHRTLGLPVTHGADEFTHTPGQVAVTPDGSAVLITTKAASNSILIFKTHDLAGLATHPSTVTDPGNVPFAMSFDRYGHLVVTEAGPSAVATFAPDGRHGLRLLSRSLTGQAATCWIVADGTRYYVSNAGSGSLSGYQATPNGKPTALGNTSTGDGTVDAAVSADHQSLFVQTGKAGAVDSFGIGTNGALTKTGTTIIPNGTGGEGIAAS